MGLRISTPLKQWLMIGLVVLLAGCQGVFPVPVQPTALPPAATPTDSPPTPTPTAIVIEIHAETDTPEPTATVDPAEPTETPAPPEDAINLETVSQVEVLNTFEASRSVLFAAEASPDSTLFAVFGLDKAVRVFDAEDLSKKFELVGHSDFGYSAAWSPDGQYLATGGGFQLIIWDMETGAKISSTPVRPQLPYRLAWSPDSEEIGLVGGDSSSHLEIIGKGGGVLDDVQINRNVLWTVDYSSDGQYLAISNGASHLLVLDAETREVVQDIFLAGPTAWDVAFSPDASRLGVCLSGGSVAMYDTANWSRLWLEVGHQDDCSDSDWNHAGDLYFTGGGDGLLVGWDADSGAQRMIRNLTRFIWGLSVSYGDQYILTAMDNGEVNILGLP